MSISHIQTTSIDTATKTVTLADSTDFGVAAAQPYYAYNIPEEITEPGEYYVDRTTNTLYLWPPADFSGAEVLVSSLDAPIIHVNQASFVTSPSKPAARGSSTSKAAPTIV